MTSLMEDPQIKKKRITLALDVDEFMVMAFMVMVLLFLSVSVRLNTLEECTVSPFYL